MEVSIHVLGWSRQSLRTHHNSRYGMSSLVGKDLEMDMVGHQSSFKFTIYLALATELAKDLELDAVGSQFKPYLTEGCIFTMNAPLLCGLGCCSQIAVPVVIKTAVNTCPFYHSCWHCSQRDLDSDNSHLATWEVVSKPPRC